MCARACEQVHAYIVFCFVLVIVWFVYGVFGLSNV